MSDKQQQFDFETKDSIKKLIKDAINDTSRPKINFQILDRRDRSSLKVEKVILPTHLTMGNLE